MHRTIGMDMYVSMNSEFYVFQARGAKIYVCICLGYVTDQVYNIFSIN